jgi:general secretion pathway protein F
VRSAAVVNFRYQARNLDGDTVAGTIAAASERLALRDLRRRGLIVLALRGEPESRISRFERVRAAGTADYILLLKQVALLLEAGVTLDQALRSTADAPAFRRLRRPLEALRRDLRQGASLATGLRSGLPQLPAYVFQLVEAGELTGQLRQTIADAARQMEQSHRLARDIRSALVYPAVLVTAGIGAVGFVFTFVVPRFAQMFKNRAETLPWLSRAIMGTGTFFNEHLLMIGATIAIVILLLYRLRQLPTARAVLYEAALRLPLVGAWLAEGEIGRWTSMLATLLGNRVPLVQSMTLARGAVHSERLKASLAQVERAVRGGSNLAKALDDYAAFDATTVSLINVGERTGNLAGMLRSAAALCQESGRERLKQLMTLIEPAAILLIGSVVGTIVIAVFLAVSSINDIPL